MYGFSLWIVPDNWKYIKRVYNMTHMPHITVKTNITEVPNVGHHTRYYIKFKRPHYKIDNCYEHVPLPTYGFYCSVTKLKLQHYAHLSTHYSDGHVPLPSTHPPDGWGTLIVADTCDTDPSKWKLLNVTRGI